jgi:hypothetical protein
MFHLKTHCSNNTYSLFEQYVFFVLIFFQTFKKYPYWISFCKINSKQHADSNGFENRLMAEDKNTYKF